MYLPSFEQNAELNKIPLPPRHRPLKPIVSAFASLSVLRHLPIAASLSYPLRFSFANVEDACCVTRLRFIRIIQGALRLTTREE